MPGGSADFSNIGKPQSWPQRAGGNTWQNTTPTSPPRPAPRPMPRPTPSQAPAATTTNTASVLSRNTPVIPSTKVPAVGDKANMQTGIDGRGMKIPDLPTFEADKLDPNNRPDYMTPDSMAKNQLNDWMNSDSDLMRSAKSRGQALAADRGALNSGQGAEITAKTMMDAAAPYVINDANTAAKFDSAQQDHFNRLDETAANFGFNANLADFTHNFNVDLAERGYDAQDRQQISQVFGNFTDSMINGMFRVMTDKGNTWDQTKANDVENVINSMKTWYAGLYDFDLA